MSPLISSRNHSGESTSTNAYVGEHLLLEVVGGSEVVGECRPPVNRLYLLLAVMLGRRAEVVGLRSSPHI